MSRWVRSSPSPTTIIANKNARVLNNLACNPPPRPPIKTGIFHEPLQSGEFNSMDLDICDGDVTSKRGIYRSGCGAGEICARYDHNPQDETVLFDDIWNSFASAFRVMFRDNWMMVSWFVQSGVHKASWIPIYLLFFLATFALGSLFPGAMMVNLQTVLRNEANEVSQSTTKIHDAAFQEF